MPANKRLNLPVSFGDQLAAFLGGPVSISVAAEVAHPTHSIATTIQLYDAAGNKPTSKQEVHLWLSDAAGAIVCTTAPDGTTAPTTGTLISSIAAKKDLIVLSDATGKIVFSAINTGGAATYYLNVGWKGEVYTSGAISFSA